MSPARRSALITGATTPLGVHVCAALLARGFQQVLCVGSDETTSALPRSPAARYLHVDLTRARSAHDLLFGPVRELGIEIVIHLAAHRSVHRRVEARRLDVEALRTLLTLAERHPTIQRLVVRSHADVYQQNSDLPTVIAEDHPLDLSPTAPAWRHERVEADVLATMRMGLSRLEIAVLRCAEIFAADVGSQLWDYVNAPLCLVPLGYDPLLNLLSLEDAATALAQAAQAMGSIGAFNIPGADTLPLRRCIALCGRRAVPVPGPLLGPAYRLRRLIGGSDFSYALNADRFHNAMVLDGRRARAELGYLPEHPLTWPQPMRPAT